MADAATTTPLTAPAATTTAPATTTTTPAPANAPDFAKDWNVVPEVGTWMGESGFKTPADFASAFHATKKLVGHDPANVIIKPKEGDGPGRLAALRALGAPANAADYGFKVPEGGDPKLVEWVGKTFAEAGVPKAEGQAIFDKWNAMVGEQHAAQADAMEAKRVAEFAEYKTKLGGEFGRVEAQARAAMREAGLTPEQGAAMENAIGVEAATNMMANFGKHLVEAAFKGTESERAGVFGTTAAAAQAQIDFLKDNPNHPDARAFSNPSDPRHAEVRAKVQQLLALASDGMPTPATANATPAYGNVPLQRPRVANY